MITTENDGGPYVRGRLDYERGVPRSENPYGDLPKNKGSAIWEAWFDGWDEARREHENSKKGERYSG